MRDPSGNDVHIDLSSGWVSRTLLHGGLDQPHSFVDISLLNCVRESHFGNCLGYSNHRFELTRGRCDRLLGVAHVSHVAILLDKL